MAVLSEHGMRLASAKRPIPNVAELVAREPIHRKVEIPFPAWVPPDVIREAARLTEREALDQLPASVLIAHH